MNIISVLNDKKLLGQFLKDESTWAAWFTFLRAFFALPATNGDMELFKKATGRHQWPVISFSECWCICGTRGGKSFITALLACYLAAFRQYDLSAGEKGHIIIVAPSVKQAKIIKHYLSSFFSDNPLLAAYVDKELNDEIYLTNNIVISTLASNFRTIRGYTAIAAIVDEVAYLNIEGFAPDTEIIRALRSRLLSTDGPLICISSPYARRGMLWDIYKRHYSNDDSNILVWQADIVGSVTQREEGCKNKK